MAVSYGHHTHRPMRLGDHRQVRAITLPPVRYDATAERPARAELPAFVREAIEERLGAPVADITPAGAGFTRGFAATVGGVFVKATDIDYLVDAYRREALVAEFLPEGVPAARPRWTIEVRDWYVLALDALDGHVPALPWEPVELHAVLDAWAETARLLTRTPEWVWDFSDLARAELTGWQEIHAHRAPLPAMPRYARAHLAELAALERALPELAAGYEGLMHTDLRLDNVLVAGARAWLCDWNHACRGPAWFDTATLLVTAYASGLDTDTLFAGHPTAAGAPGDALDAALAAASGLWLSRADRRSEASRSLGDHRRWSGSVALSWLAERRGWPVLDPPVQTW